MNLTPKAGKIDVVGSAGSQADGRARVAVIPFEDARADRAKVGSRTSMWAGRRILIVRVECGRGNRPGVR